MSKIPKVYVVSDSLGDTAESVAKATISQFDENIDVIRVPFIRHAEQVEKVVEEAAEHHAVVCHTLVSPELRQTFEKIAEAKHVRYVDILGPMMDMVGSITTTKPRINSRTYLKNISYVVSGVAASLLIMFALSFMGVFEKNTEVQVSMTADYGNRSEIVLPDGSVVKLNSGSEITYLYDPKEKIREVSFQGEGFFDVSKSKSPFVVKMAGGLSVKVWGTSFNLQAYVDDPVIQASLVEGCIELDSGSDKLIMKPGEMAVFDKQANKIKQVEGILSHSYGWLDNKLYMEDMPLSVVCKYLERWYDVKIVLQPGLGENIRYNGVIQEETVTDVMNALSRLSKIRYHVTGKNISITSK